MENVLKESGQNPVFITENKFVQLSTKETGSLMLEKLD